MYKNILVAFDGSELSEKALHHALALAGAAGAKVTLLDVTLPWSAIAIGDVAMTFPPADYDTSVAATAHKTLAEAAAQAKLSGVSCETVHVSDAEIHRAIIDTASARDCDLIVMGSHGRRGIAGLLLGSVAMKTLTHAHIPVLIYRE